MENEILLGVAGLPVLHSKSPLMFEAIFKTLKLKGSYIRLCAKNAEEIARIFRELKFNGMNITAPFKEKIFPHINFPSNDAKALGSVNTVIADNEALRGENTDIFGVTEPLLLRLKSLKGKNCLVLGAGGAGIAAAYGLRQQGADVIILNKFQEEGQGAAKKTDSRFANLYMLSSLIKDADVVINTIPYEAGSLDISNIKKGAIFFDATYKKSHYRNLAEGLQFSFIGGEEWLIHQGIHACRHFLNFCPERQLLENALNQQKENPSIISLVGFMASGKSSTGVALAQRLNFDFVDTDAIIENKMNMTIREIFEKFGEEKFREIESSVLLELSDRKNLVLSCGGGIILREENRKFLKEKTIPFWLYTSMEETLKRVNDDSRPLLKNISSSEELNVMFERRKNLYASLYGTLIVSTEDPTKTAELIYEEIRLSL